MITESLEIRLGVAYQCARASVLVKSFGLPSQWR